MDNTLIDRLDCWLATNRPGYYRQLQPGLSAADLQAMEAKLGVQFPDMFRQLYGWRNGQPPTCCDSLQRNLEFSSVEGILESKRMLDELLDEGRFGSGNWWNRTWIPYLCDGGGDFLCVDTAGVFTGMSGQMICFSHDSGDRDVLYPSLERWLSVFVSSLEKGLWHEVEEGGFYPLDKKMWQEYLREHNPGYPLEYEADP